MDEKDPGGAMEERMAALIELLEQAISKGEKLKKDNEMLMETLFRANSQREVLYTEISRLSEKVSSLDEACRQDQEQIRFYRSLLMQMLSMDEESQLEQWLKEVRDKPVKSHYLT